MYSKTILIGRLGQDPETRQTAQGKTVVNFSLCTKDAKGEAEWHKIIVWDKLAENCAKYLSKGKLACVEGRIKYRSFDGREGRVNMTEILANNVQFLSQKEDSRAPVVPAATGEFLPPATPDDGYVEIPF